MSSAGSCVVGLDVGTTSVKAVAIDREGRVMGKAKTPIPLFSTSKDIYFQDAVHVRRAVFDTIRRLTETISSVRVDGLGITGQSVSLVLLGEDDEPVFPVISHLDRRSDAIADELSSRVGGMGYIGRKVVANLAWLRKTHPQVYGKIRKVFDVKEYVGYLFTGRVSVDKLWFETEDLQRLLVETGVPAEWFGEIHSFADVLGHVSPEASRLSNLSTTVPVVVALGDSLACMLGSGVVLAGEMANVAGATEIMAAVVKDAVPFPSYKYFIEGLKMVSFSPPTGLMHKWLVEKYAEVRGVLVETAYEEFESLARECEPGSGGLFFIPDGFDSGVKNLNASITGLSYHHTLRHVARSFFECVAYELRRTLELLEPYVKMSRIVISGGGATPFTCRLKAEVLERTVEVSRVSETGCMGAALTAAYALGWYRSIEEAASKAKTETIQPENRFDHGLRYREYCSLRQKLKT